MRQVEREIAMNDLQWSLLAAGQEVSRTYGALMAAASAFSGEASDEVRDAAISYTRANDAYQAILAPLSDDEVSEAFAGIEWWRWSESVAPATEATCAWCGDQMWVPGDEDPTDTLCVSCAEANEAE